MILLVHESHDNGQVALSEKVLPGHGHVPARHYSHEGKYLPIAHESPVIVGHDAEEVLAIKGYRLATAQEQNEYAASKGKKAASSLKETTPPKAEG